MNGLALLTIVLVLIAIVVAETIPTLDGERDGQ